MKLSLADHLVIHALGLISRPTSVRIDPHELSLEVDILRSVLPTASRGLLPLQPLISLAERIASMSPRIAGCYGSLHDEAAQVMNRWDRYRMAEAWDRINSGGRA
ncbi:hypothetical protein QWZ10_19840 [Paracoccus cavernae]|uniref:Uncharacterized protein n=1 Tax=Paracoccus cavernae TaxID=1571207 RepID=A0ABT8DC02_9RHOB|nr:hypothetical protein [Paracoccus cavernae]